MRNQLNFRTIFLVVLSVFIFSSGFAQKAKKDKVRLKAQYIKIMNGDAYLDIKAGAKVNKENVDVSDIDLLIFNELDEETIKLGKVTTNMQGESKFIIKNFNTLIPDATNTYNLKITFKGNDAFNKASKTISFKNADINAKLITKDSIHYITATLIDRSIDSIVSNIPLKVQVKRLFRPLPIGEDLNFTDKNGTIIVPIEEGIPGVDGKLKIEVVLNDSEEFGTVKAIVNAPVGIPIVEESTFDKRTMWSPRNKTPLFLLIFPNLLTFGIWGIIIYLIINLFKITKS